MPSSKSSSSSSDKSGKKDKKHKKGKKGKSPEKEIFLSETAREALKQAEKEKKYQGHYEMFDDHASETTEMAQMRYDEEERMRLIDARTKVMLEQQAYEEAEKKKGMSENKAENIQDAIQKEQELAAHLIAEDRERDLKEFFKEEKLRKKHEEKMEREVKHEKEQRTMAIDDLYKKLGDYEAHKFKQLVKDGIEIKFEFKDKEKVHKLTYGSSDGSGSGSGSGSKKKRKHKYKRKGKHTGGFGYYGLAGGADLTRQGGRRKYKHHKAKFHGKSPWKKKHYKHKKGRGGYRGKHGDAKIKRKHGSHGYAHYGLAGGEHRVDDDHKRHHGKGKNKKMKKGFKGKDIADHHLAKNGVNIATDGGAYTYGDVGNGTAMNALVGAQAMNMGIMTAQAQGARGKGKGGLAAAMGYSKGKSSKDLVKDMGKNKKNKGIKSKDYKVEGDHGGESCDCTIF